MASQMSDDREDVVEQNTVVMVEQQTFYSAEDDEVDWCAWWAEYNGIME